MKIRLSYWQKKNLGDSLSPFIVSGLSGKDVSHFDSNIDLSLTNLFTRLVYAMKRFSFLEICHTLGSYHRHIMAIGSILEYANRNTSVWGTGFISLNGECRAKNVYAVRGKYTAKRLEELGFDTSNIVYGDPALLLPLLVSPSKEKKHIIGIIPHWLETDKFISKYGEWLHVIDIRTDDVKAFVEDLTSCKYILSSSLHGIIIAHAYGIPALLIQKTEEEEYGYVKYDDYFSSVDIKPYHYIDFDEKMLGNEQSIQSLFERHTGRTLPQVDVRSIQKSLLAVAPFSLKKEFCSNNSCFRN
ncbi:polysaccharide pyruvyl transferase family protein [uncultured Bacteroides sp.]|jgi:hypothetical protein|uniref:polysaccharide pyruvyl transferase family protein n=1 Tax=uncultured Bacteroides sp. TaxID=162156 RepID=UPI00280AD22E|nr:polysaccharide pyruvyl transferase family protein [uncultured Bacteroides sp.]